MSLSSFSGLEYRYRKVILKCVKSGKDTIEIIHFHNLGNSGNGKIAMQNLIKYAKEHSYKRIILEVYHFTDSHGISRINVDIVNYYKDLGFFVMDCYKNNVKMERIIKEVD